MFRHEESLRAITFILLLWGITGMPSFARNVNSHMPKAFFFMGIAVRSQPPGGRTSVSSPGTFTSPQQTPERIVTH